MALTIAEYLQQLISGTTDEVVRLEEMIEATRTEMSQVNGITGETPNKLALLRAMQDYLLLYQKLRKSRIASSGKLQNMLNEYSSSVEALPPPVGDEQWEQRDW